MGGGEGGPKVSLSAEEKEAIVNAVLDRVYYEVGKGVLKRLSLVAAGVLVFAYSYVKVKGWP